MDFQLLFWAEQVRANPNTGPIGPGLVIRDYGEAERLNQQMAEFYKTATPEQIRDAGAALQKVMDAWAERENLRQLLGEDADPSETIRVVEMYQNMNPAQKREYAEAWAARMRLGTDP